MNYDYDLSIKQNNELTVNELTLKLRKNEILQNEKLTDYEKEIRLNKIFKLYTQNYEDIMNGKNIDWDGQYDEWIKFNVINNEVLK